MCQDLCHLSPRIQTTMATTLLNPDFKEELSLPLLSFYNEVGTAAHDRYGKYRLMKVTHYKEQTNVGHEFLVLDIFDGKHIVTVRIERRPQKQSLKPKLMSSAVPNDDRITRVIRNISNVHEILVARCPPKPIISLLHVSTILEMISVAAPNYVLMSHQCYWFCCMFLEGLGEKVVKMHGKAYDLRGKFGEIYRVIDDDQAKKDIEAYRKKLNDDSLVAESREKHLIKAAYEDAVEKRRQRKADMQKNALIAVTPLLQPGRGKTAEAQALKSMLSKVMARPPMTREVKVPDRRS